MAILTLTNVSVALVSLYLARRIYWEATTGSRHRAIAKQHGCLPAKKKPSKWPFGIGHFIDNFQAYKQHRFLEAWTQALEDVGTHTMSMNILHQPVFVTDEPENIKAMLATDFDVWSIGRERIMQMSSYLGKGIFTTEGAAWKHSRDTLRPCFERSHVADVSIMEKHVNRLISLLPKDGTTIDLQPLFHELTLDIATEFLFGQSTNALDRSREDKACQEFVAAFEYCQDPFASEQNKRFGVLGFFLPDPNFKKSAKTIQAFADKIIDEELSARSTAPKEKDSPPSRYTFLDALLSRTQNRTTIRSELLNILLAGRDTTASLLSNLLFELPRHPPILSRLCREINQQIGAEIPTYQHLKEMKYLKAVINESQRLYPIVPSNSREALKDTILPRGGGPNGTAPLFVPKGAFVAFHPYAMHRRPDIYGPDALAFKPERWMDGEHASSPLRPGWGYVPFSGGPRVCIGQNFALTETMFVLVRLVQCFEIESRDGEVWREKLSLTCSSFGGCKVGLRLVV